MLLIVLKYHFSSQYFRSEAGTGVSNRSFVFFLDNHVAKSGSSSL